MTNEKMSALHVGISDTIGGVAFIFVKEDKTAIFMIIDSILIVIIIISCLIWMAC